MLRLWHCLALGARVYTCGTLDMHLGLVSMALVAPRYEIALREYYGIYSKCVRLSCWHAYVDRDAVQQSNYSQEMERPCNTGRGPTSL